MANSITLAAIGAIEETLCSLELKEIYILSVYGSNWFKNYTNYSSVAWTVYGGPICEVMYTIIPGVKLLVETWIFTEGSFCTLASILFKPIIDEVFGLLGADDNSSDIM